MLITMYPNIFIFVSGPSSSSGSCNYIYSIIKIFYFIIDLLYILVCLIYNFKKAI